MAGKERCIVVLSGGLDSSTVAYWAKKGAIVVGGGRQLRFLGIITNYISYIDYAVSPQTGRVRVAFEENSGLGVVYSNKYMEEIFASSKFSDVVNQLSAVWKPLPPASYHSDSPPFQPQT